MQLCILSAYLHACLYGSSHLHADMDACICMNVYRDTWKSIFLTTNIKNKRQNIRNWCIIFNIESYCWGRPTYLSKGQKSKMAYEPLHTLWLTFSNNDRHCVAVLQVPVIRHCQHERVRADLQTRYRGNGTVCVLDLYTIRTTGDRGRGQ